MTGLIILVLVLALLGALLLLFIGRDYIVTKSLSKAETERNKKKGIAYIISAAILVIIVFVVGTFVLNTESFKRWKKSLDSEFRGGITRELRVFSETGLLIDNYKGKFDIEYSDGRLKWVDEDGLIQIIYKGNNDTVIVNEIGEEER